MKDGSRTRSRRQSTHLRIATLEASVAMTPLVRFGIGVGLHARF
jgi:hypothetical protein